MELLILILQVKESSWGSLIAGWFASPLSTLCPGMLPEVANKAR